MTCDEMRKRHFKDKINATRWKQKTKNCDVYVSTKTLKPNILHDLLHRVDPIMCKQKSIASCWNVSQMLLQNQLLECKDAQRQRISI